ncbi:hypothetical protein BU15DRAFT_74191 [Melanogaster broomeanus]|nr:hypothetical protein BU15DRAFT_74191 [Melanogaster broomeanus]
MRYLRVSALLTAIIYSSLPWPYHLQPAVIDSKLTVQTSLPPPPVIHHHDITVCEILTRLQTLLPHKIRLLLEVVEALPRVSFIRPNHPPDHDSLLDLPAVPLPLATGSHRLELDCPNLPSTSASHPSSRHNRVRNTHATADSSPTQNLAFSWKSWKALSRVSFIRSNHPSVSRTPIYPGYAPYRTSTYARPKPAHTTTQTVPDSTSTATGADAPYTVIPLDPSDSLDDAEGGQASEVTPVPQHNSDYVEVSCCGLFRRRRGRSSTAPAPPAVEPTEHAAPPSNATHPVVASSPGRHRKTSWTVLLPLRVPSNSLGILHDLPMQPILSLSPRIERPRKTSWTFLLLLSYPMMSQKVRLTFFIRSR